jgi:regulatory protein
LVHKLAAKGFGNDLIRETLDELEEEGMQSDRRFLETFVRGRYAKGQGPQRIRQELRLRGAGCDGLDECLADFDWDESLQRLHGKKFGETAPASPREYAARIRFLSQRGFEQDRIQALLRRLRRGGDQQAFK